MKRIQVLVKHYKFNDLTDNCLASLNNNHLTNTDEIIVIDSTPGVDYENSIANKIVKIDNSIGLIESFNRFIDPNFDIYFCLNNDIVCHSNFISTVMLDFEREGNIGIIAPLYDQPGGGILEWIPPIKPIDLGWEEYITKNIPGGIEFTKHVDNCAWTFTKKLVDTIGLPDGNFPGAGWGANLDYCYRARKAGFKVAVSKGSFVHHNHRGTYGKIDPNYVANSERQRDEYLTKKYGNPGVVW